MHSPIAEESFPARPARLRVTTPAARRWPFRPSPRWLAALLVLCATSARAQPRDPTHALLPAAETARSTAVVRIDEVTKLDRSGFAATVQVERVVAGDAKAGATVRVGWEELVPSRPPRLQAGQRALLALEALPTGSLWRQRFAGDPAAQAIAARGDALLIDPAPGDVELIAAYLQLGSAAKPGVRATALARMVADATPPVAQAALARLAALPTVAAALDEPATAQLMRTAANDRKPMQLRRDILAVVGAARLAAAVPHIETLARRGGALEPEALTALGQIRRGLPKAQVEELLDQSAPALRAVGARFATGGLAERRLPPLARADPSPQVRIAAAEALAGSHTLWGLDATIPVLTDSDPQVRSAAAEALAALGDNAVPTLEAVARTQPAAARGAITALVLSGPRGVAIVRQMADDHADPKLRDFAKLALGHGPHAH